MVSIEILYSWLFQVAEGERKFLLKQQKTMLKSSSRPAAELDPDDSSILDTTADDTIDLAEGTSSTNNKAEIKRKEVLQSLRKLEKSEKHLTSKEKRLLRRSSIGEQRSSDRESNDHSEADESSIKVDIAAPKAIKPSVLPLQLHFQPSRPHSSAESDGEIHTAAASLHDTTVSDQGYICYI